MKIGIPVKCQNGHSATYVFQIDGLDMHEWGVKPEFSCSCPKGEIGQGWKESGAPYVIPDSIPVAIRGFNVVVDRCIPEGTIICGPSAFEFFRAMKAEES